MPTSTPFGCLKQRQLKALRDGKKGLIQWAGQHIWQHDQLHIYDPEGMRGPVEMLPGKWYHTDETQSECFGPFDDAYHAALGLKFYVEHVLNRT